MPEEEMAALKRSLEKWGMVDPIILRRENGEVIAGHQRIAAAIDLGMAQVPVVDIDVDAMDATLLNQTLNRIMGRWDESKLAIVQEQLRAAGADLTLTGFTEAGLRLYSEPILGSPAHAAARQNDNFNAFNRGTGEYTRLELGEIMVALPAGVYRRLLEWVRNEYPGDDRAGMVRLLTAGLDSVGAPEVQEPVGPAPEPAIAP